MSNFKTLNTDLEVDTFLADHELSFLYISKNNCSVCHALFPQIEELMLKYPNIHLGYVQVDDFPSIAGRFSIFAAPVLILFIDGKEYLREARIVHLDQFEEKLDRIYENFQ